MSEIDIYQNADIVSVIAQNFDYLSIKDRILFMDMVNNIPGLEKLSFEKGDKLLTDIFQSRALYNQSLYNSAELTINLTRNNLSGNLELSQSGIEPDIICKFAVIYHKGNPIPTFDIKAFQDDIVRHGEPGTRLSSLQHYIIGGAIWTLNGPAGKIFFSKFTWFRSGTPEEIILIYCNDRNVYTTREFIQHHNKFDLAHEIIYVDGKIYSHLFRKFICRKGDYKLFQESWYKDDDLHRDGDLPAEIVYFDNGHIKYKRWYKNGELCRDNDLAADIRYSTKDDTNYIREKIWYENNLVTRTKRFNISSRTTDNI